MRQKVKAWVCNCTFIPAQKGKAAAVCPLRCWWKLGRCAPAVMTALTWMLSWLPLILPGERALRTTWSCLCVFLDSPCHSSGRFLWKPPECPGCGHPLTVPCFLFLCHCKGVLFSQTWDHEIIRKELAEPRVGCSCCHRLVSNQAFQT